MKKTVLATFGAAALAFGALHGSASAQIISQPGESMGVALGAPLPEGLFFVDTESYGQRDKGGGAGLNVNIPLAVWSTPITFYDTRLEIFAALPFTSTQGNSGANPGVFNRTDIYSELFGPYLGHDFGNGFNVGLLAGVRPADNFTQLGRGTAADIRASVSYVKDGFNATLTFAYSGNFGGKTAIGFGPTGLGFNDNGYIDYTLTKKFGKFELGVVGFAATDFNQGKEKNALGGNFIQRGVSVGGLVGYAFDKFTLQFMVTREVYGGPNFPTTAYNYGLGGTYETRGWVRTIVPLYVAPAPPAPVVARY